MKACLTRLGIAAAAGIVALIVIAIALCFLADALLAALEVAGLGVALSALIVGVVGLLLALVIGLIVRCLVRPGRAGVGVAGTAPPSGNGVGDAAAQLGGLVARQLTSATRARPYTTVGAALVAGLAIGAIPELRKALTGLFGR